MVTEYLLLLFPVLEWFASSLCTVTGYHES